MVSLHRLARLLFRLSLAESEAIPRTALPCGRTTESSLRAPSTEEDYKRGIFLCAEIGGLLFKEGSVSDRSLHLWALDCREAAQVQTRLRDRLVLSWDGREISTVGGVDVGFKDQKTRRRLSC